MDNRALATQLLPLFAAIFIVAGCGNPEAVPTHTPSEQKAIAAEQGMSPQQRIDMIQKGPMPASAKASMIKKIKDENGIK